PIGTRRCPSAHSLCRARTRSRIAARFSRVSRRVHGQAVSHKPSHTYSCRRGAAALVENLRERVRAAWRKRFTVEGRHWRPSWGPGGVGETPPQPRLGLGRLWIGWGDRSPPVDPAAIAAGPVADSHLAILHLALSKAPAQLAYRLDEQEDATGPRVVGGQA